MGDVVDVDVDVDVVTVEVAVCWQASAFMLPSYYVRDIFVVIVFELSFGILSNQNFIVKRQ